MSTYVLYNSLSGNGTGKTKAEEIKPFLSGTELGFEDVTKITDANAFFAGLNPDDELYLCGGDGTLNRFINNTDGIDIVQPLYFFPTGTGNDFWNDLGKKVGDAPVQINEYIKDLPFVEVNGMKKRFINGIGYGMILVILAIVRELFGSGTLLGMRIIPQAFYDAGYVNNGLVILPPMALILIGCIIWIQRGVQKELQED